MKMMIDFFAVSVFFKGIKSFQKVLSTDYASLLKSSHSKDLIGVKPFTEEFLVLHVFPPSRLSHSQGINLASSS